uniref:Uncharacterized protein n=1 Tax=Cucumis melo TaxID=3656 RepID=A0A9I9DW76_CUCME
MGMPKTQSNLPRLTKHGSNRVKKKFGSSNGSAGGEKLANGSAKVERYKERRAAPLLQGCGCSNDMRDSGTYGRTTADVAETANLCWLRMTGEGVRRALGRRFSRWMASSDRARPKIGGGDGLMEEKF